MKSFLDKHSSVIALDFHINRVSIPFRIISFTFLLLYISLYSLNSITIVSRSDPCLLGCLKLTHLLSLDVKKTTRTSFSIIDPEITFWSLILCLLLTGESYWPPFKRSTRLNCFSDDHFRDTPFDKYTLLRYWPEAETLKAKHCDTG